MSRVQKRAAGIPRNVRFSPEEWRQIKAAAAVLSQRPGNRAAAADVIRMGTMGKVREILDGTVDAASARSA